MVVRQWPAVTRAGRTSKCLYPSSLANQSTRRSRSLAPTINSIILEGYKNLAVVQNTNRRTSHSDEGSEEVEVEIEFSWPKQILENVSRGHSRNVSTSGPQLITSNE